MLFMLRLLIRHDPTGSFCLGKRPSFDIFVCRITIVPHSFLVKPEFSITHTNTRTCFFSTMEVFAVRRENRWKHTIFWLSIFWIKKASTNYDRYKPEAKTQSTGFDWYKTKAKYVSHNCSSKMYIRLCTLLPTPSPPQNSTNQDQPNSHPFLQTKPN